MLYHSLSVEFCNLKWSKFFRKKQKDSRTELRVQQRTLWIKQKLFPCHANKTNLETNIKERGIHAKCFGAFSVPVLDLVGPGHIINVHTDFVGDVGWQVRGWGVWQQKNDTRPKLPVLQQFQSPVNHLTFGLQPLKLVQRETLHKKKRWITGKSSWS